jgi:3-dehydroquinate synthase
MTKLEVSLDTRSYPIMIGAGLLRRAGELLGAALAGHVVIVSNPTVAKHWLAALAETLADSGHRIDSILIPDGEAYKTIGTAETIYHELIRVGADRKATLVALGGGVVGDIAGFAAATYLRGVDFVQVPTTLLAQVDSSVGGKTGINLAEGKNLVGAFHQPRAVLIDTDSLATLPERQYVAGLAEVIKYGLIRDRDFFGWLENNMNALRARNEDALNHAITSSCENKARIVAADELELGERAILNLGHTFGHAIEAALGFGTWLHGEAVASGMVLAARLSESLGILGRDDASRIEALVAAAGLPTTHPRIGYERYSELFQRDKKVEGGDVRFVLLDAIGHAIIMKDITPKLLQVLLEN